MARPLKENLTGKRFGRLLVLYRNGSKNNQPLWFCKCDCGIEKNVQGSGLRRGYAKSCGCWRIEMPTVLKTTHGMSVRKNKPSRLYTVWQGMINRCHNLNQPHFPRYGGLGITVCDEWRKSFVAFYQHMGEPPKDGQRWTLDRIDVYRGYEPGNVRWATYSQQQANKRKKVDKQKVTEAMKKLGLTSEWNKVLRMIE